jgi:transcription initiation factor IIE alpha subunit
LLEWLHVKKICPICGEQVQESELRRTIRGISREL